MPRLAVIGCPVGHSRSPAMQNAALEALGLAPAWSYEAIEVAPGGFEQKVRGMAGERFVGANVTIPHKEAALGVADTASEAAREIGAANTLTLVPPAATEDADSDAEGSGRAGSGELAIRADNTDARGLLAALPTTPLDARTLVLGAGGAARAAVWALVGEGARVEVWNRTGSRAEELCVVLGGKPVASPVQADYDLIVNTTAVGLRGEGQFAELPLEADGFVSGQLIVDMVYGGEQTALLSAAVAAGASTVDGLEILVQQGALSLEIWTGRKPDLDVMRNAARAHGAR